MKKIAIIGGGAAGFFTAANLDQALGAQTIIFEQSSLPLQKVRVSGGGRCNVTHACFDPRELVEFYPRGKKELRSVFSRFQPSDTMDWFEKRGVALKIEDDNRIFPVSNSSLSIIECLMDQVEKNQVQVNLSEGISSIQFQNDKFLLTSKNNQYEFEKVIFTPGSSVKSMDLMRNLGHNIVKPIPSLFTFNCKDARLKDLMGISFEWAEISIPQIKMEAEGPLLITHWGLSGPGILRLSAWGALELHKLNYEFDIKINFVQKTKDECIEFINEFKSNHTKKSIYKINPFTFPKRFWNRILELLKIQPELTYSNLNKDQIHKISQELTEGIYSIKGKSTFKDEFVTAGGIDLKEIDFKTMQSKICPNLYVAGEILNIDAITGGFNFQACWSEGYIIAQHLRENQLEK